ncbi:MAG: Flp pilus assembly protein CpaB [Chloroflexi bacterium]|nr:Flp pilus assembly protein CpaB [Chloroflexota bacterium]
MITRSRKQVLGIAAVFGLMAAGLTAYTIDQAGQDAAAMERVVVAKRDIPARTKVSADELIVKLVPKGARHPEAMSTMEPLIGKVTRQPITSEEQILTSKFFGARQESGLAFVVPPGRRAVAVSVDEHNSAGGLIAAGDKVDIIGACNVAATGSGGQEVTKAIFALQSIEVLAVAQKVVGEEATEPLDALKTTNDSKTLSTPRQPSRQATAKTITLALTPHETQSVVLLEENATCSLRLVLRSPNDGEQPDMPEAIFDPSLPLSGQVRR